MKFSFLLRVFMLAILSATVLVFNRYIYGVTNILTISLMLTGVVIFKLHNLHFRDHPKQQKFDVQWDIIDKVLSYK